MHGNVIISPVYHEGIVHVTDVIPVTDNGNFAIAVSFEEPDFSISNKCKECITFLFCTSILCFIFFIIMGGLGYMINSDD